MCSVSTLQRQEETWAEWPRKKLTWEQMKRVQCFKGEAQDGPTENGIDRTEIRLHRLPEREQPSDLMPHYI